MDGFDLIDLVLFKQWLWIEHKNNNKKKEPINELAIINCGRFQFKPAI